MFELVLPASLDPSELRCAEEVARELGLETEKVETSPALSFIQLWQLLFLSFQRARYGLKIVKPGLEVSDSLT